jgi:hypothetical protein
MNNALDSQYTMEFSTMERSSVNAGVESSDDPLWRIARRVDALALQPKARTAMLEAVRWAVKRTLGPNGIPHFKLPSGIEFDNLKKQDRVRISLVRLVAFHDAKQELEPIVTDTDFRSFMERLKGKSPRARATTQRYQSRAQDIRIGTGHGLVFMAMGDAIWDSGITDQIAADWKEIQLAGIALSKAVQASDSAGLENPSHCAFGTTMPFPLCEDDLTLLMELHGRDRLTKVADLDGKSGMPKYDRMNDRLRAMETATPPLVERPSGRRSGYRITDAGLAELKRRDLVPT